MLQKIIYFIKKTIHQNKQCKQFCVTCEYFEICKSDL